LSSSPTRVLVAEADEIILALISHILHRQGYAVDVAVSADEAMQHLARQEYRAIVIDSKLATALKTFPDHLSCTILLSPNASSDLPVHAVIQKPVEFGLLVDTVAGCVK
jgi:CheY-like chemotaxis protein